jgi:hypothetical protein
MAVGALCFLEYLLAALGLCIMACVEWPGLVGIQLGLAANKLGACLTSKPGQELTATVMVAGQALGLGIIDVLMRHGAIHYSSCVNTAGAAGTSKLSVCEEAVLRQLVLEVSVASMG